MTDYLNPHGIYPGAPSPDLALPDFAKGHETHNETATKPTTYTRPGAENAQTGAAVPDGVLPGECEQCGCLTDGLRPLCDECAGGRLAAAVYLGQVQEHEQQEHALT